MKTVSVLLLLFGASPRGEVIELTGNNCIHCQNMVPIVHRLQREGLPIRQVDVDRQPDEARRYAYEGLPTFLVVHDGKVISRTLGAVSESELRRLVSKIPAEPVVDVRPISPRPTSSPGLRVELGDPAAVPRPLAATSGIVAEVTPPPVEDTDSSLFPKLFRRSPKTEPAIRGQSQGPAAVSDKVGEASLAASVKLTLHTGKGQLQGSGTIIDSRPGRTLLITAGTPFSQMPPGGKIEVEVPMTIAGESRSRTFVAKLLKADLESDLALVEFPTDQPLPKAAIAPTSRTPQLSDRVACIGGAAGAPITRNPDRVTALNKYTGPDTIECSGVPLAGRCGGGLFNAQDELIGVCINFAEDAKSKTPNGGIYCGLKPIHDLLRSQNLAALLETPEVPLGQPGGAFAMAEAELGKPRPMPSSVQPAVAMDDPTPFKLANDSMPGVQPVPAIEEIAGGPIDEDQEVIVIIRSKKSAAPTRVIHIHKASPKLRAILEGPTAAATSALTGTAFAPKSTTSSGRRLNPPPLAVN